MDARIRRFAALLAVSFSAQICRDLHAQAAPGLHCGSRTPNEYSVVLDVSSSLQRNTIAAQRTRLEYGRFVTLLSGLLCANERLTLYTFAPDSTTRMTPVATLTGANRTQREISASISKSLRSAAPHTDFHLALNSIRQDILGRQGINTVFLVTDGSFYPSSAADSDRTVPVLAGRLTDLAALADSILSGTAGLFVVGVGAGGVEAVDRDLGVRWSPRADEQRWSHGGVTLDLQHASGDGLLRAVFGPRYVAADTLSLWPILIAPRSGTWGYGDGAGLPLGRLENVKPEHILYLPPSFDPGGCAAARLAPDDGVGNPVQSTPIDMQGRVVCSIASPSHAQITALIKARVDTFAIRQQPLYQYVGDGTPIRGLHDFAVAEAGGSCDRGILSRHFATGGRWPVSETAVAELIIVAAGSDDWRDRVPMVRYPGSRCLVPNFPLGRPTRPKGSYLFILRDPHGDWLLPVKIEPPRIALGLSRFRPGGFPFPPDKLALVHLCVYSIVPIVPKEHVTVELSGQRYDLGADAHARCKLSRTGKQGPNPAAYSFDGVVLLETTRLHFARASIAQDNPGQTNAEAGDWLPVDIPADGRWFLAWRCAIGSFLVGVGLQLAYLVILRLRKRLTLSLPGLIEMALGVLLSGMLFVVFTEFVVMIWESQLGKAEIPVPFAFQLTIHGLGLIVAIMIPERLREVFLSTGG